MLPSLRRGVYAGALLVAVGAIALATGLPVLFPSLGPTAYLFAVAPGAAESRPHRAVGGHVLGVLAGLAAYHVLAPGLVATAPPPALSMAAARLAAAGVVAVGLTTAAMVASDLRHAPACATTLIVSLGLLSTVRQGAVIVAAVVALVGVETLTRRLVEGAPAAPPS